MTDKREHSGEALRDAQGFSLLEVMTVVAILGILATIAFPSMRRMMDRQEAKASATQVAGLLSDARTRAVTEGTPHLVYFNPPTVGADGNCGVMAVEVRDADHSYSITPGDTSREFKLTDKACQRVKQYGVAVGDSSEVAAVPLPAEDRAAKAPDVGSLVADTVTAVASTVASGSSGEDSSGEDESGSGSSGSSGSSSVATAADAAAQRSATIAETVLNGATFPVDAADGRPVIAFSERGVAVDPANPTAWGSGAGGVYLTDGDSTVIAALVAPLGDVQLRVFDSSSAAWR